MPESGDLWARDSANEVETSLEPRVREWYALGRLRGEVLLFERLSSTNTLLREMAVLGAAEGTVVVADEQEAGRGRRGRSWHSPPGAGFYGSILLRPGFAARTAPLLTLAAAVAVAETLDACGARGVAIKWPNDVLIGGRKASGILTEASFLGGRVDWAVAGIGINVLDRAVPPELADRATSLDREGVRVSLDALRGGLLAALDRWYDALLNGEEMAVRARWEELAPMARGHRVEVMTEHERYEATTRGLTASGLLAVERGDGTVVELAAAEVSLSVASCQLPVASG